MPKAQTSGTIAVPSTVNYGRQTVLSAVNNAVDIVYSSNINVGDPVKPGMAGREWGLGNEEWECPYCGCISSETETLMHKPVQRLFHTNLCLFLHVLFIMAYGECCSLPFC